MKIGIDLGGHTLIAALVSDAARGAAPVIVRRISLDTPRGRGASDVIDAMTGAIANLAEGQEVSGAGVAMPGMIDADRRHARRMPNFPKEWDDLDVAGCLDSALNSRGLGIRARIENDANCYALGEGSSGAAIGIRDFIVLTMGTGIGCGIVSGGRLLVGSHGMAGEAGHLVVRGDVQCRCGGMGHAETLAAADGTSARARTAGLPEDFGELWGMMGRGGAGAAIDVIEVTLDAMARVIASVCHLLDPELVILGGGMSKAHGIGPAIRERAIPYLSRPFKNTLRLEISPLGNDAALYGAAGIALARGAQ
ncbi:MAG: ROK family protein [Synergistaceae bacterium]|jgi:glucokinase|nr:ROK family protein [Synergistaceae bacterium]